MNDAALTQLLSVGVVWVAFHCVGMCGPIVGGVVGSGATSSVSAIVGLARYQLGRMAGLSAAGAVAGGIGFVVDDGFERGGAVLALVMGALLLWSAVGPTLPARPDVSIASLHRQRQRGLRHRAAALVGSLGDTIGRLSMRLRGRPFVLGIVLSALPCMIVVWALGLAASTHSVLGGARIMVVLVAMTTVPLLPSVLTARLATGAMHWPRLRKLPPMVSGVWLLLVGLAGWGIIDHHHIVVDVWGPRTIMLW